LQAHDQVFTNNTFANVAVPTSTTPTTIASAVVNINNPSTCRTATAIYELEADIDFNLPTTAQAVMSLSADPMVKFHNTGSAAQTAMHTACCKVVPGTDVPPGGIGTGTADGQVGSGVASATYSRAQVTARGWLFAI
jgi:hypothetical protein